MQGLRTQFLMVAVISMAGSIPFAAADSWTQLDDGTSGGPARYHTQAVYDPGRDRMVFCAGMEASNRQGDVWAWDFATAAWSQLADDDAGPARRQSPCAVFVPTQDVMIVHGGEHNLTGPDDDTWIFDFATNSWDEIAPTGAVTRDLAVAIHDPAANRMVIYSGEDYGHNWLVDVRALSIDDPSAWTVLHNGGGVAPMGRIYSIAAFDPDTYSMLVFGGQNSSLQMLNDLWRFDLTSHTWTLLDDGSGFAPSARYRHSGGVLSAGRKFCIFGGSDGSEPFGDTWQWDLVNGGWTLVDAGTPPVARSAALCAVRRAEELVVFGGNVGFDLADLWSLRDEVAAAPSAAGSALATLRCWPNPVTDIVSVRLAGAASGHASLRIHDSAGRCIRELWSGLVPADGMLTDWDGLDTHGRIVPAGTYFVRASLPAGPRTTRVTLLR